MAQDCDNKMFFLDAIKSQFYYQDTIITDIDRQQVSALDKGLYKSLQKLKCYRTNVLKEAYFRISTKNQKARAEFYQTILADSVIKDVASRNWSDNQDFICYSFFKSADNWYTLTFLTYGHYVPTLIFVNFNPQGQFNTGGTLFSRFIDAGQYLVTGSTLRGDRLVVSDVVKSEKYYEDSKRFTTLTDSTATSYVVRRTGQFVQVDEHRIKFEK